MKSATPSTSDGVALGQKVELRNRGTIVLNADRFRIAIGFQDNRSRQISDEE